MTDYQFCMIIAHFNLLVFVITDNHYMKIAAFMIFLVWVGISLIRSKR